MDTRTSSLDNERDQRRARLKAALNEEDDPLALYQEFIEWTIRNYDGHDLRSSAYTLDLLREATNQFKTDPAYRTDLRYLKMWIQYAGRLNDKKMVAGVFSDLVKNSIGTLYALLYTEFASVLEKEGRLQEADAVYKKGIAMGARPLEKLKAKYRDFQGRVGPLPSSSSSGAASSSASSRTTSKGLPVKGLPKSRVLTASTSRSITSSAVPSSSKAGPVTSSSSGAIVYQSTGPWYAPMLAPPDPGKRPEKLRFNLSLLFTEDKVEYSAQEARARSLGLLGKKWGPPPPSEMRRSPARSESPTSLSETDDTPKAGTVMRYGKGGRKSVIPGAEPTMTINTKEALADVLGMYNAQELTMKMVAVPQRPPASALKKIEAGTPVAPSRQQRENENAAVKTPAPAFRPFVDENSNAPRSTTKKFTPFMDPDSSRTPSQPRAVLGQKGTPGPSDLSRSTNENLQRSALKSKPIQEESPTTDNVFSRVFTPEPQPKLKAPNHERARSLHEVLSPSTDGEKSSRPPPVFKPFVDENARTPFRVFSPPPQEEDPAPSSSVALKPVFTPFTDAKPAFMPFKDEPTPPSSSASSSNTPHLPPQPAPAFRPYVDSDSSTDGGDEQLHIAMASAMPLQDTAQPWPSASVGGVDDDDSESDQYQEDYVHAQQVDYDDQEMAQYEDEESFQEEVRDMPLGGRFGRINVLTPITERTYEFTSTKSVWGATPSQKLGYAGEDDDYNEAMSGSGMLGVVDEQGAAEAEEFVSGRSVSPFRFGDQDQAVRRHRQRDSDSVFGEDQTGNLSLNDTIPSSSKLKLPNPCNPFDPAILSALLSQMVADPQYYPLEGTDSDLLAQLEKFTKRGKKDADTNAEFLVNLNGQKFGVVEKLGEGGFGSVFRALDKGLRADDADDDDDDFEDDEEGSMVALKVVKPCNIWEYHVLRRMHDALPETTRQSLVLPHALYAFRDESFMVLEYCSQGMLLNIVNNAGKAGVAQQGGTLEELLVVFFTIELLRLVESMHSVGFIHGDLKIDNCLLRLEEVPGGKSAWVDEYQPSGEGGWSCKGLKLIDFGRTIDTRLFPPDQEFIADWTTDERDCFEIRENRPWTYQTDYFGLAGIIYCMLYGKYIQENAVVLVSGSSKDVAKRRYKIGTPMKRYWQTELWNKLFDILLNPTLIRPEGQLPLCEELAEVREEMEKWLQSNSKRLGNITLKGMLRKVELACT